MFNVKKAIAGLTTSLLIAAGLMAVTPLAASAGNSDICTFYRQDGTQASKPTPLEVPFNTKAAATTGVTLRLLSDPNFAINTASSFNANYLGIKLDSGSGVNDPYIQVSGFTGNITLHDGLSSSAEQATPAAGSGSVAYFLMKATTASSNPQGYTVTVWDGDPSNGGSQVCHVGDNTSTSDSRYERVVDTISAQANKVNSVAISVVDALRSNTVAPLGIGNFAKVVVQGDTGTIGSGQKTSRTTYANKGAITLAPAPNASFPDDAWSLEGVDVIITQKGAASPLGLINGGSDYLRYLYMDTAATCGGGAGCSYTATYYYKAKQVFNTRVLVTPIQYISSGTQTKKTGSYPTGTNLPDFEPPAITSPDTANLEKNGVPNTTLTFNPQVKSDLQLVGACLGAQGFTPDANPSGPCTTYYDSSKGNWDIVYDPVSGNYSATFLGDPSFLEGTSYADFVIYNKYYDGNNWIVQVSNVVHLIAHISQGLHFRRLVRIEGRLDRLFGADGDRHGAQMLAVLQRHLGVVERDFGVGDRALLAVKNAERIAVCAGVEGFGGRRDDDDRSRDLRDLTQLPPPLRLRPRRPRPRRPVRRRAAAGRARRRARRHRAHPRPDRRRRQPPPWTATPDPTPCSAR